MDVSIVVPTLNEAANVQRLVELLSATLTGYSWEVIFVDDDSQDGTPEVAKSLSQSDARVRCLHRIGRRGLAGACIEGVLSSAATCIVVMDADLQHDERIIPAMLERLSAGADLVIGTRQKAQSDQIFSGKRSSASRLATDLAVSLLGARVTDPMSGFFAIRRRLFNELAPGLADTGFKILLDLLTTTSRPLAIEEVMYDFRHRESGHSKFGVRVVLDYLGLVVHKLSGGLLPHRFLLFCIVGSIGVAAHLTALRILMQMTSLSFVVCQVMATYLAMTFNFFLNNILTYQDMVLRGTSALKGLLKFYLVCSLGTLANVGVADLALDVTGRWWLAGFAGIMTGSIVNFAMSDHFVWTPKRKMKSVSLDPAPVETPVKTA